jgi:hypothetical protein
LILPAAPMKKPALEGRLFQFFKRQADSEQDGFPQA